LRLCADACRALDVLHSNDIIHRDVSPGNLLISRTSNGNTHVLIADLGVAKSMVDAVGATMTAGTPSYMAPEHAMGVTPLDRRVDIYSLTAVTYAMLTGHPRFLVRSIADILAGILPSRRNQSRSGLAHRTPLTLSWCQDSLPIGIDVRQRPCCLRRHWR